MLTTRQVVVAVLLALFFAAGGAYLVYDYHQSQIRMENVRREKAEADRLSYLELMEKSGKVTGIKLSPEESDELKELRRRATLRKIDGLR